MKIIMADDDSDDRYLSSIAFKRLKSVHSLDFVFGGQELVDQLRATDPANMPDLILLDLNMPGKNGFETLTEIKSDPKLCHLNVTIFSTSNSERDMSTAKEKGADNYIVKPADLTQLIETFGKMVG